MYTTYRATSSNTDSVYYGYARGDFQETFFVGATRSDARADVRWLKLAGGIDDVRFDNLGEFEEEYDAFLTRNDFRALDKHSITQPTIFPFSVRLSKDHPEKLKSWKKMKANQHIESMKEYIGTPVRGASGNDGSVIDVEFQKKGPALFTVQWTNGSTTKHQECGIEVMMERLK